MAEPRLRSDRGVQRPFAGQSALDPAQKAAKGVIETKRRYLEALDWAKRNVPDEHGPFAASAANSLRHRLKGWPSAEQVRARLIEQGRSMSQLEGSG